MARPLRFALIVAGCLSCEERATALKLLLELEPDVQVDRLQLVDVSINGTSALSLTRTLPESSSGLLRTGDTLRIEFDDANAGGDVEVRGVGLFGDERRTEEAQVGTTLERRKTVAATLRLSSRTPAARSDGGQISVTPSAPMASDGGAEGQRPCPPRNFQPDSICSFGYQPFKRETPEVVLVLDRSSAMLRRVPGGTQSRWDEMVSAIGENLKGTETAIHWGLKLFPSTTMCNVVDPLEVPVGVSNAARIMGHLGGTGPVSGRPEGSPIAQGIQKAATSYKLRYLVLATDGVPDCPADIPGETEVVQAVATAERMGLRTFVIGTASLGSPQHRLLNWLADAGGEPLTGDQRYFSALNRAQMVKALDDITRWLTSCVLTSDVLPPQPDYVAVNVGSLQVFRDPARREGWDWGGADFQTLHLYGSACTMLMNDPNARVEMVSGCDGYPPPPPMPCTGS